jgi:hypothetical protein
LARGLSDDALYFLPEPHGHGWFLPTLPGMTKLFDSRVELLIFEQQVATAKITLDQNLLRFCNIER